MNNKEAIVAVYRAGAAFIITILLGFVFAGLVFKYGFN